jgi:uncharacterized repeat protein (TIGR03803 family)
MIRMRFLSLAVALVAFVACSQRSTVLQSGALPQAANRSDAAIRNPDFADSAVHAPDAQSTAPAPPTGPNSGLIVVGGIMYGTTVLGGGHNFGTVYSFDPVSDAESKLYSFYQGEGPRGNLVATDGNLYGTTYKTDPGSVGEIFGISQTTDKLDATYLFAGNDDGATPDEGMIYRREPNGGTLFGTTSEGGGSCRCGTIFAYNVDGPAVGKERVLHSFQGGTDGEYPESRLINPTGTIFYGTTSLGGSTSVCRGVGCGTVFSIDGVTNQYHILYRFQDAPDGDEVNGTLYAQDGFLYGTTESGGADGYGSVFKLNIATGGENVLHSFPSYPNDGEILDDDGLAELGGLVYGLASSGGAGYGTVFTINPATGQEQTLYSFKGAPSDGSGPSYNLTEFDGELYGTTVSGGANNRGSIFKINTAGVESLLYSF